MLCGAIQQSDMYIQFDQDVKNMCQTLEGSSVKSFVNDNELCRGSLRDKLTWQSS